MVFKILKITLLEKKQEIRLRRYPRDLGIELANVLIKVIYLANNGIDNNVNFLFYKLFNNEPF